MASLTVALAGFAATAQAAGHDEVMDVIMRYANLEGDLAEQAKLIRSDRVMITGVRQSDQARNLEIQLAARKANEEVNGKGRWITEIESPEIRMYGDTAVASMVRRFHIFAPGSAPISTPPHWLTLVLVREKGKWGIAHSHISPLWQAPN